MGFRKNLPFAPVEPRLAERVEAQVLVAAELREPVRIDGTRRARKVRRLRLDRALREQVLQPRDAAARRRERVRREGEAP